ncbi:MAG: UDP-2,4-diacetamido-2,4,6-trideoxy-beta-L-altropyranose hydrolase [Desulfovibrio sp.]|uniref:UDP-2,4-diacetamido-2,4, 6-trideoxy-beta-L-altropyranose hydrolase n=1 Tax=Desulfovibrio sp. TaxID=885 RepID=UPI0025C1D8BC|nr:UDP-2,4-diacetamido-2,4,6-trideoxy-beta-L-altropyranose hydrolase [Desulfovibrio sp.]MBS6830977.1 UDP-2,4-diacetamido-2,4,6-trideoxy-beta-L-altropyranose hydrolase [Desulfovibrio sp.]
MFPDQTATLLIRADAAPRMGAGHVMRCLALAQAACKTGLNVHMICRLGIGWLRSRLAKENIPLHILPDHPPEKELPEELLQQLQGEGLPLTAEGPIWIALDGYHFDGDCQKAIMCAGYRLLVIDDYAHLPEYHCDILLNQNIGAEKLLYHGTIGHKLLGLDYVLLRQEFLKVKKRAIKRISPIPPQNILITLGGGNFIEYLEKIAAEMDMTELASSTVRVIQGAMNAERVRAAFVRCPARLEILSRVDDMPALLLDTDLCITAGGSTCWELCYLGVPFLTVELAENQHAIVELLHTQRIAKQYFPKVWEDILLGRAAHEKASFGGNGIPNLLIFFKISLCKVEKSDIDFIFGLANEEDIRAASFNNLPIPYGEHIKWFSTVLKKNIPFFIVNIDKKPFGYVRFQKKNEEVQISIAISKEFRGKGYGEYIIREACKKYFFENDDKQIIAYIKKGNTPSLKSFKKSGFHVSGDFAINGTVATKLYLKKNFLEF